MKSEWHQTDGAIDRDRLSSLCRRDAFLVTHEQSRDRLAELEARRVAEQQAAAERARVVSIRQYEQKTRDLQTQRDVLAIFRGNPVDIDAPWTKLTVEKLKSIYRLHVRTGRRTLRKWYGTERLLLIHHALNVGCLT